MKKKEAIVAWLDAIRDCKLPDFLETKYFLVPRNPDKGTGNYLADKRGFLFAFTNLESLKLFMKSFKPHADLSLLDPPRYSLTEIMNGKCGDWNGFYIDPAYSRKKPSPNGCPKQHIIGYGSGIIPLRLPFEYLQNDPSEENSLVKTMVIPNSTAADSDVWVKFDPKVAKRDAQENFAGVHVDFS